MDVIITNLDRSIDGEWTLELPLDFEEYHEIKRLTGLRSNELQEAFAAGDLDLNLAWAWLALRRAGRQVNVDILWKAKAGQILLRFPEPEPEKKEVVPPGVDPPQSLPDEPGGNGASSESETTSGATSPTTSEDQPEIDPSRTGPPNSETLPE